MDADLFETNLRHRFEYISKFLNLTSDDVLILRADALFASIRHSFSFCPHEKRSSVDGGRRINTKNGVKKIFFLYFIRSR